MSERTMALLQGISIDGDLDAQLAALRESVDADLADFRDPKPIETADEYKSMKKWRAAVRAVKKPIEERRKASKKRYTDLIKTFDRTVGEITAPIDELDAEYKALIEEWEGRCRAVLAAKLEGRYAELAPNLVPLVPFDRIADPYWFRATFGERKAFKALEDAVARLARQYGSVMSMEFADEAEREWAVSWWAENLPQDSGEVALAVTRNRERLARAAELNAGYRAANAPVPEPGPEPAAVVPETATEPEPPAPAAPGPDGAGRAPQGAAYRVVIDCPDSETLRAVKAVMVAAGFHGRVERISNDTAQTD